MSEALEAAEINRDARLLFYAARTTHLSWYQLERETRQAWRARAARARDVMRSTAKLDLGVE